MKGDLADRVLFRARVLHDLHWSKSRRSVYVTRANQLVGGHADLLAFRKHTPEYAGWESHHIVEEQDLRRLGIARIMPARDQQVCVLLPERGHRGRINSRLRMTLPIGASLSPDELIEAYEEAYWLLGDYCGGGGLQVRKELVATRAKKRGAVFSWRGCDIAEQQGTSSHANTVTCSIA